MGNVRIFQPCTERDCPTREGRKRFGGDTGNSPVVHRLMLFRPLLCRFYQRQPQEHVIEFPHITVPAFGRAVWVEPLTAVDDIEYRQAIVRAEDLLQELHGQSGLRYVGRIGALVYERKQAAVQMQAEMPLVAEHRHAVEGIVFQQPAIEPVPVFRQADFRMVLRLGGHDAPDMRILQEFRHTVQTSGLPCPVDKTHHLLRDMFQHQGEHPLPFALPCRKRGREEQGKERNRIRCAYCAGQDFTGLMTFQLQQQSCKRLGMSGQYCT